MSQIAFTHSLYLSFLSIASTIALITLCVNQIEVEQVRLKNKAPKTLPQENLPERIQADIRLQASLNYLVQKWQLQQAGIALIDFQTGAIAFWNKDKPYVLGSLIELPLLEHASTQPLPQNSNAHIDPFNFFHESEAQAKTLAESPTQLKIMALNQTLRKRGFKNTFLAHLPGSEIKSLSVNSTAARDMGLLIQKLGSLPKQQQDPIKCQGTFISALENGRQGYHYLSFKPAEMNYALLVLNQNTSVSKFQNSIQGFEKELKEWVSVFQLKPKSDERVTGIYLNDEHFSGKVAFTFDDGPGPETLNILDLLKQYKIKATFFITGQRLFVSQNKIDQSAAFILKRIVSEGHTLGNHGFQHLDLSQSEILKHPEKIAEEFEQTERGIRLALGYLYPLHFVRPPYGERGVNRNLGLNGLKQAGRVDAYLQAKKQSLILWQSDSLDWEGNAGNIQTASSSQLILSQIRASQGGVVLFHDIYPYTVTLLGQLLPELKKHPEFQSVSLSELLLKKYHPES